MYTRAPPRDAAYTRHTVSFNAIKEYVRAYFTIIYYHVSAFRLIAARVRNETDLFTLFSSSLLLLLLLFSYHMILFR